MEYLASGGSVLLAIFGFAFVILIHELGHFVMAKLAGVRVDAFSIGFPPTIWSRRIGETTYRIGLLPFGGYVKMLGQEDLPSRTDDADPDPRSYSNQPAYWRAAILLGGVVSNLVSSYLIIVILVWSGMPHTPALVGRVYREVATLQDGRSTVVESPARRLDLRTGDRIRAINGATVRGLDDVQLAVMLAGSAPVTVTVERAGQTLVLPATGEVRPVYSRFAGTPTLGFEGPRARIITAVSVNSYGIQPGQTVEAVAGTDTTTLTGDEVETLLLPHVGRQVTLRLGDGDGDRTVSCRLLGLDAGAGGAGLPLQVDELVDGGGAAAAGMERGDVLVAADGVAITHADQLLGLVQVAGTAGRPVALDLRRWRDGAWQTVAVTAIPVRDPTAGRWLLGIHLSILATNDPPSLPPGWSGPAAPLRGPGPGHRGLWQAIDLLTSGPLPLPADLAQRLRGITGVLPPDARLIDARLTAVPHPGQPGAIDLTYVTGGRATAVGISAAARDQLEHLAAVNPIGRLFGQRPQPALIRTLTGATVISTGEDHHGFPAPGMIQVAQDGRPLPPIDLADLPQADREAILSLAAGDVILGISRPAPVGGVLLESVRGATGRGTATLATPAATDGVWLEFGRAVIEPFPVSDWTDGFVYANHLSRTMIHDTLLLIPRFFRGGERGGLDATKSLSGPVGIFGMLKSSAEESFKFYLKLIALIGLNLFLINLLPIPITDGGQLLLLGIECLIRRPVPAVIQNMIMWLGLVAVILLMLFVVGLDISREIFG
jgi:membrane-associated protease RseP (regulator of RpoE activity)